MTEHSHHHSSVHHESSTERHQRKWWTLSFWVMGIGSLLWLLLRSGTKPKRLAYPCQRVAAAKYAFLLAIPAVVGSGFFKLADISNDPVEPAWGPIALATVVSFVIGYAVIAWLLRYISTHDFFPFVVYRISLAAVVAVLLLTGFLEPLPATG